MLAPRDAPVTFARGVHRAVARITQVPGSGRFEPVRFQEDITGAFAFTDGYEAVVGVVEQQRRDLRRTVGREYAAGNTRHRPHLLGPDAGHTVREVRTE